MDAPALPKIVFVNNSNLAALNASQVFVFDPNTNTMQPKLHDALSAYFEYVDGGVVCGSTYVFSKVEVPVNAYLGVVDLASGKLTATVTTTPDDIWHVMACDPHHPTRVLGAVTTPNGHGVTLSIQALDTATGTITRVGSAPASTTPYYQVCCCVAVV